MFPAVDTRNLPAVQQEVERIFSFLFPGNQTGLIARAFGWADAWFNGRHSGYLPIDARYHDLEHTLQGTLCLTRLLQGRHLASAAPEITPHLFELGLLAILMHDTGYLKRTDDLDGTGAKYTITHVRRSGEFARAFLEDHGYTASDIAIVQNMIRCTGVNVNLDAIPFASELEQVVGFALGTADLLGQMAAPDYVEKLPVLFLEFAEAVQFSGGASTSAITFGSADELMRNTPSFWENYVWPKLSDDFGAVYRYLNDPFPHGPNPYLDSVVANLSRLRRLPVAAAVK